MQRLVSLVTSKTPKYNNLTVKVFLFALLLSIQMEAQTILRLVPGIGVQSLQCYVTENINADPNFKTTQHATASLSLGVQADIKRNWTISTGCSVYKFVVSYKHGESSGNRKWNSIPPASNLFLDVHKRISTHRWIRIKDPQILSLMSKRSTADDRYLFVFRSKFITGVSHNWISSIPGNLSTVGTNASLYVGVGLQFFNSNQDGLQLSLIYSKGLKEIALVDIYYRAGGTEYSGQIGSKGSFITIQAAYPLQFSKL
jgi:hypothetical protein